jgi:signal transduction histidine kinase
MDPFFTTGRARGGSGLGLAIVHNLVHDALGGSVEITSRVGVGTTVTIHLPRTAPE